jgi:hypothetical protein
MSARHSPESPKMTFWAWAVCLISCWLTMQIVDLAIMLARRAAE